MQHLFFVFPGFLYIWLVSCSSTSPNTDESFDADGVINHNGDPNIRDSGPNPRDSSSDIINDTDPEQSDTGPDDSDVVIATGRAGASVHYYFYNGYGMRQCPGRVQGYSTQEACDDLGRSQTENGPVNQVALFCDSDPEGCIIGEKLMVTATDRCPHSSRSVRVTYESKTVTLRIVDRTPGNGGFDLGIDPYIDLGIYDDFLIGLTGPQDIYYECIQ